MVRLKLLAHTLLFTGAVFTSCSAGTVEAEKRCVGLVCIDVVGVGDPGNTADVESGHGKVDDPFAIGEFEVTAEQYVVFLNAAAADLSALSSGQRPAIEDLWQKEMFETYDYVSPDGVISRTGSGTQADPYVYQVVPDKALGENSPRRAVLYISWFAAARFANWLHNGGGKASSTETGAYTLDYRREGIVPRNAAARWWIPSLDEWYKAAFFDPSKTGKSSYWLYPTRNDSIPTAEMPPGGANSADFNSMAPDGRKLTPAGIYAGTFSNYGAKDMAGSMWEWTDTPVANHDGEPETLIVMGGSWSLGLINASKFGARDYLPASSDDDIGFRVATTKTSKP